MSAVPWTSRKGGRPGRTRPDRRGVAQGLRGRPRRARSGRRARASRRSGRRDGRLSDSRSTGAKNGTTAATRVSSGHPHGGVGHEVAAGRLAHEREPLRVELEAARAFFCVQRMAARTSSTGAGYAMPGREAVAHREPGDAGLRERADERARGLRAVAADPAAAVDEQRRGERSLAGRRADVEAQALAAGARVLDVPLEPRGRRAAERGRPPAAERLRPRRRRCPATRGPSRRCRRAPRRPSEPRPPPRLRARAHGTRRRRTRSRARAAVLGVAGRLLALRPAPVVPALGPHDLRHLRVPGRRRSRRSARAGRGTSSPRATRRAPCSARRRSRAAAPPASRPP